MSDQSEALFTCPKCGGPAELRSEYESVVACPKCGESKILMSFLSNGDIETVVEGTGEYYELDPGVRKAQAELDAVRERKFDDDGKREKAIMEAFSRLAAAYNESGREAKAENMAADALNMIRDLAERGVDGMRDRYFDQVSVCASYAVARGDFAAAAKAYDTGLEYCNGQRDIQAASMLVNRSFLLTMRKLYPEAQRDLEDALSMIDDCFARGETGSDPYIRATALDSLRLLNHKNNKDEIAQELLAKAIAERKSLLGTKLNDARAIELADDIGLLAENSARQGDAEKAIDALDEGADLLKDRNAVGYGYALMNRAVYQQSASSELPETFLDDMNAAIPALESAKNMDKRTREAIAQAYMFRSMVRDPKDYDHLLGDLKGSYDMLIQLAREGDVNELFLMSAAHSYLVLLNMKDKPTAEKVRAELNELGISQKDLDGATRGTIGNASRKQTFLNELSSNEHKPIPGRRLRPMRHFNKKDDAELSEGEPRHKVRNT